MTACDLSLSRREDQPLAASRTGHDRPNRRGVVDVRWRTVRHFLCKIWALLFAFAVVDGRPTRADDPSPPTSDDPPAEVDDNACGPAASGSASISVRTATWDRISRSLEDRRGVTVVDFWSTACVPCLRALPELVSLARQRPSIRCVAVSLDYDGRPSRPVDSYRDDVHRFLRGIDAEPLEAFLCETPSDQVLRQVRAASLPAVMIYRDGKIVSRFVDAGDTLGFNYHDDVIPSVDAALKAPSSP